MKKFFKISGSILLVVILLAILAWILSYLYDSSNTLQNLFGSSSGNQSGLRVATDDPGKVELFMPVFGGKISLFIFTFIIFLQIFAVIMAGRVVKKLSEVILQQHLNLQVSKMLNRCINAPFQVANV